MVCLAKPVLETALAAINDLQGDNLDIKNELVGNFTIISSFFLVSLYCCFLDQFLIINS